MLDKQIKIIEYWRKKYLTEALVVIAVALIMSVLAIVYIYSFWLKMLLLVLFMVISYTMIKELKADLQTRGEAIILAKGKDLFEGLQFDYGQGLRESEIAKLNVLESYMVRECQNVMKGNGYYLEEDWFYTVISAKFLAFNQTVFKGIVAVIDKPQVKNLRGEFCLINGQIEVKGAILELFHNNDIKAKIKPLFSLFKTRKIQVISANNKIYFLIDSEKSIFYQFLLLRYNPVQAFIKRVQQIDEVFRDFSL